MEENTPTKLTLEMNGVTMSWEGPWDAGIDDIMEGFVGCLRGLTFGEWVISRIKEWCEANEVTTKEKEPRNDSVDTSETESVSGNTISGKLWKTYKGSLVATLD